MWDVDVVELLNLPMAFSKFDAIWDEVGLSNDDRLERQSKFFDHIKNRIFIVLEDEELSKISLDKEICSRKEEADGLAIELGFECKEVDPRLTLIQKCEKITKYYEKMVSEKEKRMSDKNKLCDLNRKYSLLLEEEMIKFDRNNVPSLESLEKAQQLVDIQENLIRVNAEKYNMYYSEISDILRRLSDVPASEIFCSNTNVLSEDFLLRCKRYSEELKNELRRREISLESLVSTAESLSNNLTLIGVDVVLLRVADPISLDLIAEWTNKVSELECILTEKKSSLLECLCTEMELMYFGTKQVPIMTMDDTITDISDKLRHVRMMRERLSAFTNNITKWKECMSSLMTIEAKSSDPDRLRNRGGVLLKDAADLQRYNKECGKLEAKIFGFVIDDEELNELIEQQKTVFRELMAEEKQRLSDNKVSRKDSVKKSRTEQSKHIHSTPLSVSNRSRGNINRI